MYKILIICLTLIGSSVLAQTVAPDPLQQILDKLNSMENRLDRLEGQGQPTTQNKPVTTSNNVNPASTSNTQTTPQKSELIGGMIVKIKHGDSKKKDWFSNISPDNFAGFVTTKNELTTSYIQQNSIGYKGAYAISTEGFLNAQEKGIYNFGVLHSRIENSAAFSYQPKCMAYISLNGTELTRAKQTVKKIDSVEDNMLVNGSVSLEPGIYEYNVFSVCDDYRKDKGKDFSIKRLFLIKTPNDLSMRPIELTDILYKK